MPHLVLHYSANLTPPLDFTRLFGELHRRLAAVANTSIANFKSRAEKQSDFLVGDGAPANAFVHLEISLLTRSPAERAAIAEAALQVLTSSLAVALDGLDTHVTVHVHDLDPEVYRKVVIAKSVRAGAA